MFKRQNSNYYTLLLGSGVVVGLYLIRRNIMNNNKKIKELSKSLTSEAQNKIQLRQDDSKKNIYKICLTGGPCSGKTSSLTFLSEKLRERGYNVYLVPEAATLIAGGGGFVNIENFADHDVIKFQISLLQLQTVLENTFVNIAMMGSNLNSVILCDRGLLDGKAYMSEELWQNMLEQNNLNENDMFKRYNAVCHLVTAADGAEKFYNLSHEARHESVQLAVEVDKKTQKVWSKHPSFVKLDNYSVSGFSQKLQTLFNRVSTVVGLPLRQTIKSVKYLLDTGQLLIPSIPSDIAQEHFDIVDVFPDAQIINKNQTLFQKMQKRTYDTLKKSKDKTFVYIWVEKIEENGEKKTNVKRQINFREYRVLMDRQDKQRRAVEKHRVCFVYDKVYMTIDTYPRIKEGFTILKIHPNGPEDSQSSPPPFLRIKRNVTTEQGYKTRQLAKTSWYVPEGDEYIINKRKMSNIEDETQPSHWKNAEEGGSPNDSPSK